MPRSPSRQPSDLRLNQAIAHAGVCSRRAADVMIKAGRVLVNDAPAEHPGARFRPGQDRLCIDGCEVTVAPPSTAADRIHLAFHKPVEVVSTMHDPQGRKTVADFLSESLRAARVLPIGRLDYMSEGLLLLTNDYALINTMTHPSHPVPKVYEVRFEGPFEDSMLQEMRRGMTLSDGERLRPVQARLVRRSNRGGVMHCTLHQGVNRQLRRMCRDLGLSVKRLIRIRHGPVSLADLPSGQLKRLRDQVFKHVSDGGRSGR